MLRPLFRVIDTDVVVVGGVARRLVLSVPDRVSHPKLTISSACLFLFLSHQMSEDDQSFNPELRQVLVVMGKHLTRDQVRASTASCDCLLLSSGNRARQALATPACSPLGCVHPFGRPLLPRRCLVAQQTLSSIYSLRFVCFCSLGERRRQHSLRDRCRTQYFRRCTDHLASASPLRPPFCKTTALH